MKEFFAKKDIGFYILAGSIFCALLATILYAVAGNDSYGLEPLVIVFLVISIAVGLVFLWKDFFKAGAIVVNILFAVAVGVFINNRFIYFAHQFYGIASEPVSGLMVFAVVLLVLMMCAGVASAFFKQEKEE